MFYNIISNKGNKEISVKGSEKDTDARRKLAREVLEIWDFEIGDGIERSWFADDDAKVAALDNIREYLLEILK